MKSAGSYVLSLPDGLPESTSLKCIWEQTGCTRMNFCVETRDHSDTLFRGNTATASLETAIINAKYVNSNPPDRVSRDFKADGLNLSKRTMSNWTVWSAGSKSYMRVYLTGELSDVPPIVVYEYTA